MSFRDFLSDVLEELEGDLAGPTGEPLSIVWKGLVFPCVATTESRGTEIVRGGKAETIQLTIYIRKKLMPQSVTVDSTIITVDSTEITSDNQTSPPKSGDRGGYKGKPYRVLTTGQDPSGAFWKFDLGSVNR